MRGALEGRRHLGLRTQRCPALSWSFDFLPCCESTCGKWAKHECRWGQGLFLIAWTFLRRSEGSNGASGHTTASLWVGISIVHSWASRSESRGLTSVLLESPVGVYWVPGAGIRDMGELPTTASETKIGMPSQGPFSEQRSSCQSHKTRRRELISLWACQFWTNSIKVQESSVS